MSVAALPGGMLGARSRLRPLLLSLVGWCASCNNIGSTISYCKLPVNIANSEGCKCNKRTRNFEVLTGHTFISFYMQPRFACSP